MEYEMVCEDGFTVKSSKKDEVASMGAMHVLTMHPEEKLSMRDAMKMVKPVMKMKM